MKTVILLLVLLLPSFALAFGSPNYIPDGSHPKLFLSTSKMSELTNKRDTNDAGWLALKAKADLLKTYTVMAYSNATTGAEPLNTIFYSYQGSSWLDAAQVLGLAYKVTGDNAYADKLIELSDVMTTATYPATIAINKDSYYPTRNIPVAAALIFDWLYDYAPFTAAKKSALISTVNGWYDAAMANGYDRNGAAESNYFGGHILGFGLWGLATYGDNSRASEIYTNIRSKWNSLVVPSFASGGFAGGYPIQSFNYGPNHFVRLLEYANCVLTASGENIYPSNTNLIAKSLLYNLMPNRWQSTDEGTMPNAARGVMSPVLAVVLSGILSTDETLGDQAAYFADNLATPPVGSTAITSIAAFERVMYESTRTRADYRSVQPLYYASNGDGHLYYRSDWTDNAVWSSFASHGSINADHQNKAAGHIALSRGADYLLVNAGQWKGPAGYTGTPTSDDKSASVLNTLFFNDGGAYMYTGDAYKGGQFFDYSGTSRVANSEFTDSYVYEKANLLPAYSNGNNASGLNYFYRNYVNIGGTTIFVYDHIQAKSSDYTKELRFHLNNQAVATNINGVVQAIVGSSRVSIKPISPSGTLTLDTSDVITTMPRVRIIPPESVTDWNPLTVIYTSSSSEPMPATANIDTINMSGVVVADTIPKIVMFAKDGTQQNSVAYNTAPYTGTGNHMLVDIVPGTYDIYRDGSVIASATASSQGVLRFTADSGDGVFAVSQSGAEPNPIPGICGPSSGLSLPSTPVTGLCSAGTPSAVSGTGPWTWTCAGSGGGSTASCGATLLEIPSGGASAVAACSAIAGFR